MGNDSDPDAETVMPAGRREEPHGTGLPVRLVCEGHDHLGTITSVSTSQVVVRATALLPIDASVSMSAKSEGTDLTAEARVIWSRSQGPMTSIGLVFADPAMGVRWEKLIGT